MYMRDSQSTDTFLAALDRVFAYCGTLDDFYSDCSTNYVGQLKNLFKDKGV